VLGLSCQAAAPCTIQREKNIASARRVSAGVICITAAAGFDPAVDLAMAGVEFSQTSTPSEGNASALTSISTSGCHTGEFKVVTQRASSTTTGAATNSNLVAFWFAIP
jgi:hypothetical protein